jgi:hypothetical protein
MWKSEARGGWASDGGATGGSVSWWGPYIVLPRPVYRALRGPRHGTLSCQRHTAPRCYDKQSTARCYHSNLQKGGVEVGHHNKYGVLSMQT